MLQLHIKRISSAQFRPNHSGDTGTIKDLCTLLGVVFPICLQSNFLFVLFILTANSSQ